MISEKKNFREKYKEIRKNIDEKIRQKENQEIYFDFFALDEYKNAKSVFIYVSFGDEAETLSIIEKILADGKRVSVPLCHSESYHMSAVLIDSLDSLKKGAYGIMEPAKKGTILEKDEIDLIVVPGICFSKDGSRIGYGGGYYDRFLEDYKGFSVGFAFSECIAEYVPTEDTDKKVDLVISGKKRW